MRRSDLLYGVGAATLAVATFRDAVPWVAATSRDRGARPNARTREATSHETATGAFARLEAIHGGRLGVAVYDAAGLRAGYRVDERFPICSTFKVLLVAAVLARVDTGRERLAREIAYGSGDLLAYAPVTRANVGRGRMTVAALCGAAIEVSDNTAANLLLRSIGGPPAVTAFARSLGDAMTRLDRIEPALNTAIPGDPRDTTSPLAMAIDVRRLVFGGALSPASRGRLAGWMVACRTGGKNLRAGLPPCWRAGDKTGSGDRATRNDVAFAVPPERAPIVVAAYFTGSSADDDAQARVLAAAGRIAAATLA